MTVALAFVAAYFVMLALLGLLVRPNRLRLARLGSELCESDLNDEERRAVVGLLSTAYSWRSALILTLAYAIGLFQSGSSIFEESDRYGASHGALLDDTRIYRMDDDYLASVAAVNPIFGAIAYTLRAVFVLKLKWLLSRAPSGSERTAAGIAETKLLAFQA